MAFKMKGNPYKMGKMATKSTMKMAKEAMKMKKESPMEMKTSYKMKEAMAKMKSPMELKKDSPMDKYKSDAQRKAVHASKAERGMTMKKEEAMKMKKEEPMKMKKPLKAAKPDYIDLDGDGNKTESMRKAAADKKSGANINKKEIARKRRENPNRKPGKGLKKEPMTMKKEAMKMKKDPAMKMKKPPLKQDKTKNKKRKLSVMDKLSAASRAISTSEGPFGDTNFIDRYKQAKAGIRKTGRRPKDALMGSNR